MQVLLLVCVMIEIELQQAWQLAGQEEEAAAQSTAESGIARHLLTPNLAEQRLLQALPASHTPLQLIGIPKD